MNSFTSKVEIRWADLDPNFHVLHSKYYDFGAYCRMDFLVKKGLTPAVMLEHNVGLILFREECFFKRELKFGDEVSVNLQLSKITSDYARWSMKHEIWKNGNILAAIMNVDIAWMDTIKRKLTVPPKLIADIVSITPKTEDFQLVKR